MWPRDQIVRVLRARGELWDVAPGVTALRGDVAMLARALERAIGSLCALEADDEWRVPPATAFATLARAEYFASFPHWLTVASHLRDDEAVLRGVAEHAEPAMAVREASASPKAALNPAVCYHVYAALAGTVVASPAVVTAQSECWRHEGAQHSSLERGWTFTMREVVCVGAEGEARAFLERWRERLADFARALNVDATIEPATDPFFAPTARAKRVLQGLKGLKHELLVPVDAERRIAASSFNLHDTFFGEAFDIRLADGGPATSACVAFGLERWLLAVLVRHGPDVSAWPSVDMFAEVRHG